MKNVLMVLEAEFPPDERVEKEIETLSHAGFHVTLAAYTMTGRPVNEKLGFFEVRRKPISRLMYKSSAAILILPFYFRFWMNFLTDILESKKFDIIHVHDLPLSKVALRLSRKFGLKVVCDQHEYYSNWIVRTKHYNTKMGKIIRFFSNWVKYEKKYLQQADLVITVENSLREIYLQRIPLDPSKILALPNTPSAEVFNLQNVDPEIVTRYRGKFVLFYAGSLDEIRGLDFVMKSMARLRETIDNILFVVAGKENRVFSIRSLARKYEVEGELDFIGWIPVSMLPSYIAAANVCFSAPKADNLEVNNAIATKIYQYALLGKPIITSEARLMKEFVESNKLGFSVPFGDVDSLCEVLKRIHDNPDIALEISEHGTALRHSYSWEHTSQPFLNYYLEMSR